MLQRYLFLLLLVVTSARLFSQRQDKVDFTKAKVSILVNPDSSEITGKVTYAFEVLANVDSVFLDARNIDFFSVKLNKKKIKYNNNKRTITLYKRLKKGRNYLVLLAFKAKPKQAVYFKGFDDNTDGNEQIWTQGQGKYTSHWLPSFDNMEEKVEFDLDITFDDTHTVIANGKLQNVKETDGLKTWSFDMVGPMSSYLSAFAIGDYDKQEIISTSGFPIENYYYPQDSLKAEPTYRYTKEIFDFMEKEIGVPYPWQNYKQVPVKDFLYAGMENTGATIFSDAFVIDSVAFVDKNYVNVNAHELAHQWFGNLVTEKDGKHHWLHEGFATYYAYLAEKEIYGNGYFQWKLYDTAIQLWKLAKDGKGEALTNPKASSLTFYEKGAWALVILRNQIGEVAFKQGIKNYLEKYEFKNVTIENFLDEMEATSGKSLSQFRRLWLESPDFLFEKAKEHLMVSSTSVAAFLNLKWELTTSLEDKGSIIQKYWEQATDDELKARIIINYHKSLSPELIGNAFRSESIKIRRELALAYEKVPLEFKTAYESLLNDKSYVTLENALYRLWISFPQDRAGYLEKTKGIIGLPNRNVRLLWLLLATLTNNYDNDLKERYLSELYGYTSPQYAMEIRRGAFGLIGEVFKYSDQNIKDLINATVHHSWQFRNYARDLLESLLKDDDQRKRIINLSKQLKDNELRYINSKLNLQ
ncbi:MAG: M1 family metallopeptidase [Maribacter sp.]|nr:M1 family metallopeptidase [Maribacter sp.]